jgi:N-acetylmuramoyl-L-alanine amidase
LFFLAAVCCGSALDAAPISMERTTHYRSAAKDKEILARRAKKQILILLDPGHGGDDFGGASKSKPRTHEKFLNLSTAIMVKDHLQKNGYRVQLTRSNDTFLELQERVDLAHDKNATIFVSLHYNTAPSADAQGIEVYYYDPKASSTRMTESKKLAQAVLDGVVASAQTKSRGIKHGNFRVIRETKTPAILVEGGFLTNPSELKQLKSPAYLNKLAKGVADGIDKYLQQQIALGKLTKPSKMKGKAA